MNSINPISFPQQKGLLYSNIADAICEYIKKNQLHVGDKLPSERTLSEELKISRNSVREALRVLENSGIISVRTGIGSFVERDSINDSVRLQFIRINFSELLEIKAILELGVIRKLTMAQNADLQALDLLLEPLLEKWREGVYDSKTDLKFHQALMHQSGNKTLCTMFGEIIDILDGYWAQVQIKSNELLDTIPYHEQLLRCIHQHDINGATAAYHKILDIDIEIMSSQGKDD